MFNFSAKSIYTTPGIIFTITHTKLPCRDVGWIISMVKKKINNNNNTNHQLRLYFCIRECVFPTA